MKKTLQQLEEVNAWSPNKGKRYFNCENSSKSEFLTETPCSLQAGKAPFLKNKISYEQFLSVIISFKLLVQTLIPSLLHVYIDVLLLSADTEYINHFSFREVH